MTMHAAGTFEVKGWDEKPYLESAQGTKLTRASVRQAFHGDLEGEGAVEWLMAYRADGTADFVGMQHVSGSLAGRSGSFVLQNAGTFDGKAARGTWSVVPGSGSEDLRGLKGAGTFEAPMGPKATFTLDYELN